MNDNNPAFAANINSELWVHMHQGNVQCSKGDNFQDEFELRFVTVRRKWHPAVMNERRVWCSITVK